MTRRTGLILAGCVAAVLLLTGTIWVVVSGIREAAALSAVSAAVQEQRSARADLDAAAQTLAEQRDLADQALDLATDISTLAPKVATREATGAFVTATGALIATAQSVETADPLEPVVIPGFGAPALEEAAVEFRDQAEWYRDAAASMTALADDLEGERRTLEASAGSLFESVAAVEPSLEADSWVSPVAPKLEVRAALKEVVAASFDADGVAALQDYSAAVLAMAAAHDAELATFAGPNYDNKVAALAFANSISGGVLLEFDWVPELFGFGSGYGMGAQATLEGARDGVFSSKITITENAAARWGDGGPEAIIAHEVGHAITNKCWALFEQVAGGDYEAFATAWAIGMGYTNNSNGTTAYGRPSDELIEATKACR